MPVCGVRRDGAWVCRCWLRRVQGALQRLGIAGVIRLRFVGSRGIIPAVIRRVEYGFWATHVEAVRHDGKLVGALHKGGLQVREADYDAGEWTQQLVVDLPAQPDHTLEFWKFLNGQVGAPYDYAAIAGFVFGAHWRCPGRWICSEVISAALEKCGWLCTLAEDCGGISPRDLLLIISGRVQIGRPQGPRYV